MQRSMIQLYAVMVIMLLSCRKDTITTTGTTSSTRGTNSNARPIAAAGNDINMSLSDGFMFTFSGLGSSNPAHPFDPRLGLSMSWKQVSGPEVAYSYDLGSYFTGYVSTYGKYEFELTVKNSNYEDKDSVILTITPGACNPNLEYVQAEFLEESSYNLPGPSNAAGYVASGRLILAGGGDDWEVSKDIHIYDASLKKWTTAAMSMARREASIGANKDYAFFAGETGASSNVIDIYEFSTGKISTARLSSPRLGVNVSVVDNKAVFAGGTDLKGNISDVMDIYDLTTRTWSTSKFLAARNGMTAGIVGNKIYYTGGFTAAGDVSDRVDIYDVLNGLWTTLRLNKGRYASGLAVMGGSKLVLTGGYDFSGPEPGFMPNMDWLDLSTGAVKQECLFSDYYGGAPATYSDGLASVFIGQNLYSCYNKFLTRFDVSGNKWKISKGMKDQNLSGFFSWGDRLLAIAHEVSNDRGSGLKIYEVKF